MQMDVFSDSKTLPNGDCSFKATCRYFKARGVAMKNIRVLVANRPRLMRELILATISDQPDIEIVGEIQDETQIDTAVSRTDPDFLIVALEGSNRLPEPCHTVLQKHPGLRIIAISPDRNSTVFYWASLNIQHNQIEASEQGVLNALRGKSQLVS
jgi:chemotaxis response regulator CheB